MTFKMKIYQIDFWKSDLDEQFGHGEFSIENLLKSRWFFIWNMAIATSYST